MSDRTAFVFHFKNASQGKNCVFFELVKWVAGTRAVEASWNAMAHAQKPDFVFRRNGRVHLNRRGHQLSRLLAAEVCASAVVMVVMLDTPCSGLVWRVLATHSIRQFPLQFPSRASPCAITFQLEFTFTIWIRIGFWWNVVENPQIMLLRICGFREHQRREGQSLGNGREWNYTYACSVEPFVSSQASVAASRRYSLFCYVTRRSWA